MPSKPFERPRFASPPVGWSGELTPGSGTGASSTLRVYRVRAGFETARGGSGKVEILDWITLRDPDRRIRFAVVNEGTGERLLTGGDFDIESMRVDHRGELWFGEEFGPFLLHTDATGAMPSRLRSYAR